MKKFSFFTGMPNDRKRYQLIFHNDNTFEFRNMDVQDGSLVLLDMESVKSAWPIFNSITLPFEGMTGIKRTKILPCIDSDILWDPFNKLDAGEKPEAGPALVKEWILTKVNAVRYRYQSKPPTSPIMNKLVLFSGICAVGMVMILAIVVMANQF